MLTIIRERTSRLPVPVMLTAASPCSSRCSLYQHHRHQQMMILYAAVQTKVTVWLIGRMLCRKLTQINPRYRQATGGGQPTIESERDRQVAAPSGVQRENLAQTETTPEPPDRGGGAKAERVLPSGSKEIMVSFEAITQQKPFGTGSRSPPEPAVGASRRGRVPIWRPFSFWTYRK